MEPTIVKNIIVKIEEARKLGADNALYKYGAHASSEIEEALEWMKINGYSGVFKMSDPDKNGRIWCEIMIIKAGSSTL